MMRVGEDRVKAANRQSLLKEFENIEFKEGKPIDDFAVRVNYLVGGLRELGEEVKDGRVLRKVLRVAPKKWKQVAVSIEMLLDLDTRSIEELIGRLCVAEDADNEDAKAKEVAVEGAGRLYLIEEKWEARRRQRNKERRRGGDAWRGSSGGDGRHGNGNRGNNGGGDDDRSEANDDTSSMTSGSSRCGWSRSQGRCFKCGGHGHIAKFCHEKKKEKALLTEVDEEPTLL